MTETERWCKCCGEIKPLSEFHKHETCKNGHSPRCKTCMRLSRLTGICQDCGKAVDQRSIRCHSCSMKVAWARGDFDSEEVRRRMSESHKKALARGDYDSKETRRKKSESAKRSWARGDHSSKETMRKISKGVKAAYARGAWDKESRRKQSEGTKAAWARGDMDGVFNSPSKPETILAQALDGASIVYETQHRLEDDGRPFDFFVPPKTLIEVDGIYWHDDTKFPGRAARDMAKTALAKERGYRLIRITDIEINEGGSQTVLATLRTSKLRIISNN